MHSKTTPPNTDEMTLEELLADIEKANALYGPGVDDQFRLVQAIRTLLAQNDTLFDALNSATGQNYGEMKADQRAELEAILKGEI